MTSHESRGITHKSTLCNWWQIPRTGENCLATLNELRGTKVNRKLQQKLQSAQIAIKNFYNDLRTLRQIANSDECFYYFIGNLEVKSFIKTPKSHLRKKTIFLLGDNKTCSYLNKFTGRYRLSPIRLTVENMTLEDPDRGEASAGTVS